MYTRSEPKELDDIVDLSLRLLDRKLPNALPVWIAHGHPTNNNLMVADREVLPKNELVLCGAFLGDRLETASARCDGDALQEVTQVHPGALSQRLVDGEDKPHRRLEKTRSSWSKPLISPSNPHGRHATDNKTSFQTQTAALHTWLELDRQDSNYTQLSTPRASPCAP